MKSTTTGFASSLLAPRNDERRVLAKARCNEVAEIVTPITVDRAGKMQKQVSVWDFHRLLPVAKG
jgi:hypothetical protein